jgi:crotonobetainyl-CoA:carnitine CoA-transferase CaiB-like acyl-CoA transferase
MDHGLHGTDACYRLYETQDGWIQIAAVKESDWTALCGALGLPELADDARFAVAELRREHREELEALLAPRFLAKTQLQWANALNDAGVPNEIPVDTKAGDLVLYDADNVALALVAEYEHPIMGTLRQFGELVQFSDAPRKIDTPPPRVGENTREILEWLGYDGTQIDELKAGNIVNWPGAEYPWVI